MDQSVRCTDQDCLEWLDLGLPAMSRAAECLRAGRQGHAVDAALDAITDRPMRAFVSAEEARETGDMFLSDSPHSVEPLRRIVDLAGQPDSGQSRSLSDWASFQEFQQAGHEARNWIRRGRGFWVLAELYALTGEKVWADRFAELLSIVPRFSESLSHPEKPFVPLYSWHPGATREDAHNIAHVVQYINIGLPVVWPVLDREARKAFLVYLAETCDVLYRGARNDPAFNIPLHALVAAYGTAACVPYVRTAPPWRKTMEEYLGNGGRYVSRPFADADGYFGEGFSYQNVNHMLLCKCLLIQQRSLTPADGVSKALEREVRNGFDFIADVVRPDGATFLVGDGMSRASHEHEQDIHEMLHLGAALFDRPDWKRAAGAPCSTSLNSHLILLMPPQAYRRWREMPAPEIHHRTCHTSKTPRGGYLVLRAGRGVSSSCCALLKAATEHNHAHLDPLSINLFARGRELVGDSGVSGTEATGKELWTGLRTHALCRLAHLNPYGPRLQRDRYIRRHQVVSEAGWIHFAMAEHDLIDQHRQRRALLLLMPGGKAERAFFVVWDRVAHINGDGTEPSLSGAEPPARFVETNFPFHAPGGSARLGEADGSGHIHTAWSCHTPDALVPVCSDAVESTLTVRQAHEAIEHADSEANIQITALDPQASEAGISAVLEEGSSSHFGFAVPRPMVSFRWRGRLAHEAAYVLLPFDGLAEHAPYSVSGQCHDPDRPGFFSCQIGNSGRANESLATVHATGLSACGDGEVVVELSTPEGSDTLRLPC